MLGFDRHFPRLGERTRCSCRCGGLGLFRCLGLERFQGAQGAPQLGERAAAVAQQGVERAGAVAVADQGLPEPAAGEHVLAEQVGFQALGAGEPPARGDHPLREHGLQRAFGRQLRHQRRLEGFERRRPLARQDDALLGAHAVLQRVLRRARLALGSFRAARFRAIAAARRGARGIQDRRARRAGEADVHGNVLEDGESGRPPGNGSIGGNRNKIKGDGWGQKIRVNGFVKHRPGRLGSAGPCDRGNPCPRQKTGRSCAGGGGGCDRGDVGAGLASGRGRNGGDCRPESVRLVSDC